MHRAALAAAAALATLVGRAAADVAPTSEWKELEHKKLGLRVRHPPGAKVDVDPRAGSVVIGGPELATVTITVAASNERDTGRNGGLSAMHVEWTVAVPKRIARCVADGKTLEQAMIASSICESIVLAPGPRSPHVEIAVAATGLADPVAYEQAVRGRAPALDACWKKALVKDADLPEGSVTLARTFEHGQPAASRQSVENFFDHDAKALAACLVPIVKAVPVSAPADAATAEVKVEMICLLY
jgi:hypothetical protein